MASLTGCFAWRLALDVSWVLILMSVSGDNAILLTSLSGDNGFLCAAGRLMTRTRVGFLTIVLFSSAELSLINMSMVGIRRASRNASI